MNIFFCDIRGTFDGNDKNRKEQLLKLVKELLILTKNLQIDNLIFKFVTADSVEYLVEYVDEIKKFTIDTPIDLTSQFSNHQKYENGKIINIPYDNKVDQIRHLSEKHEFNKIFFADDSLGNHKIIRKVLSVTCPDTEVISFIPSTPKNIDEEINKVFSSSKKGISGLIESINKYNNYYTKNKQTSPNDTEKKNIKKLQYA